jgi:Skp family chaperone for outer membrane proteins
MVHATTKTFGPFLIIGLALCLSWSISPVAAQEQAPLKIGVLDLQGVMEHSVQGKRFQAEMEKLTGAKQQEITSREKKIQDLQRELETGASVLSDQAKREKQDEAERLIIELRRYRDDAERELESRYRRMLADVEEKILPIITAFGEENNYTLILARMQSGLVYADRSTDVTPMIVSLFDQAMSAAEGAGPVAQ